MQSVGARLSVALLLVVAGALAVVYLVVVPSLEDRLVEGRQDQARRATRDFGERIREAGPFADLQQIAQRVSNTTNTRAVVLSVVSDRPLSLSVLVDEGSGGDAQDVAGDPVARAAARTLGTTEGIVRRGDQRFAEVAEVSSPGLVTLTASSLTGADATVELVQRRILLAGSFALLAALLVGYGGAWVFARRIRRLERAAERIAAGHFDQPVSDPATDELGQLARAFDRMRERLAKLERARREFIANASHELRTPLFSLGGHLELLVEEDLDEATRREFLVRMREQVDRLAKLAEELLDLSRLDAGRLRIETEPVDLARIADLLVEEFGPLARSTEHALELAHDGQVSALGDEQRVLQIGRALVENALRHTPGGTRIRIQTGRDNGRAVLVVEDDGPGIAREHAAHVFDRFYRTDGTRASGSGLGLAIARELAEVMGGEIELESVPGRTAFRVRLPSASA
jgi:signal transduction histidine kinase